MLAKRERGMYREALMTTDLFVMQDMIPSGLLLHGIVKPIKPL